MARQLEVEVANFVCRFGDLVLLDLLDEVVLPAFTSDAHRKQKETDYFFMNQEFRYLEKNDVSSLALCCRLVKNTMIRRHQIYSREEGIIPDEKALESAPSAVAILLLQSHRLLYVREVPSAPSMTQFGSTFAHFMKPQVMAYRDAVFQQRKKNNKSLKKRLINHEIPFPDLSIVPVVSSESLKDFMNRFAKLNTLKISVAPTNNEIDNEDFFKALRIRRDEAHSTKTIVQHQNTAGLDKKGCLKQVQAAKQGNVFVEMRGTDKSGDALIGNNENYSVRATLGTTAQSVDRSAKAAFEKYNELIAAKVVDIGKPVKDYSEKLKESHKTFSQEKKNG